MVKCSTNPGGLILDPFCGSGTSLVAAKNNGVNYVGIDNDPESVEISRKRLSGELTIARNNRKQSCRKGRMIFED